ncbi:MAG: M48 family metalloprotease [Alphaproteobacteria bacterium]|nr:M48 family metalloprotease [Alphaproteobacteria bacterium]
MTMKALLLATLVGLAACSEVPATGESGFSIISPAAEARMGAAQHPELVRAFGGVYSDPALQAYIDQIGARLTGVSETPGAPFTFTVLNTEMVNAMALPGGYVYVTRGLIALADDEAELAGVMAHEIGHVTARHSSERATRGVLAELGAAVLGAVLGDPRLGQLAQVGGEALLQRYSREQEFEADTLGIRYLERAGYPTGAMASFLATLRRHSELEARRAGRSGDEGFGIMASHPRTLDRVQRAAAAAGAGNGQRIDPSPYMRRIDGMLYGDDPAQGVVRGRSFTHPALGLAFEVPEGFALLNGESAVLARHPSGAAIVFDGAPVSPGMDVTQYVARTLAGAALGPIEPLTVSGLPAATTTARAQSDGGPMDMRMVAVRWDEDTLYRFLFLAPAGRAAAFDTAFRRTTHSFRRLSPGEAAQVRPLRLRTVQARPGDTIERLAAGGDMERIAVLNDLRPGQPLEPGRWVKLIE